MKKFTFLTFALGLLFSFNSCKKCSDCILECRVCSNGSNSQTICRDDNTSIEATIADFEGNNVGYTCNINADDEQNVCTSGLFYRLRHDSEIQEKEDAGYKCN